MTAYARGGQGNQLRVAQESALGTPGAYHCMMIEGIPEFKPTRTLIDNNNAGYQHPLYRAKPESVQFCQESSFSCDVRVRRALADGGTPDLAMLFQSGGWKLESSTGDTTLTGTPTVSALIQAANKTGAGQFILVEQSTGLHVPVLVSALSTATITPHVRMAAAPANGAAVTTMHTLTPTAISGYQVPADKTLSFIANTHGFWNDAQSDLAIRLKACALASVGDITFKMGEVIKLACSFHGLMIDMSPDDIAADSFTDSAHFCIVNPDFQFSIQNAAAGGDIALVSTGIISASVSCGLKTVPIWQCGASDSVGGIIGYMLIQEAPTITFSAQFAGTAANKKAFTELEGSNTSVCIQCLQPTRDLDHPAFAVALPNCHMMAGQEPKFNLQGNIIEYSASYTGSTTGLNSGDEIDEVGTSPIFIGVSGQAAA